MLADFTLDLVLAVRTVSVGVQIEETVLFVKVSVDAHVRAARRATRARALLPGRFTIRIKKMKH